MSDTAELKGKALGLIVMLGADILGAWVLMLLWTWFLVPLGLPGIGTAHALGLLLILGLGKGTIVPAAESQKVSTLEKALYKLSILVLTLGFGYVAHLVMV